MPVVSHGFPQVWMFAKTVAPYAAAVLAKLAGNGWPKAP